MNASFYRTSAGAGIDPVLEFPGGRRWAVEIKRGLEKGFHFAREDLKPERSFVVYSGKDGYPVTEGVDAIGLSALANLISTEVEFESL
jgi:uncharacterized protein